MVTSEERIKILQMISEGKISPEEGAKLINALTANTERSKPASGAGRRPGPTFSRPGGPRWLRVRVTDMNTSKAKVNVNLPLRLVDAGLNIASHFVEDIDLDEISSAISDALDENLSGKIIDVMDEADGEHVEIFIE